MRLKLNHRIEDLKSRITSMEELVKKRSENWSRVRLDELQDKIEADNDRMTELVKLQSGESKSHRQRLQQMNKRETRKLLVLNHVGKRKLGDQGRKPLIDSDTEEQIAKAIEDKATYHGRRHNTTMYTNRRVKVADLPGIANHFLALKGKPLVRSKTTVWNWSEPRRKNSIQAKFHLGKGLFCTKKPPKTEASENESTHHQRAHVNNVKMYFFSRKTEDHKKYCLCRSIDDKAYIRPGTGEGMNHARNQRILTLSADERARKLPLHDWPERKMYITPSANRIFSKVGETIEDNEKLITDEDYHFVFTGPNFFIGSSGSVWASETVNLRYLYLNIFEMSEKKSDFSSAFRSICAQLHDSVFLYNDMCEPGDFSRAKPGAHENPHTYYEQERLGRLHTRIDKTFILGNNFEQLNESEKTVFTNRVQSLVDNIIWNVKNAQRILENPSKQSTDFICEIQDLQQGCQKLLQRLNEFELPGVKPGWCDLTDAGPGVGVSNFEVRFRDAELSRIWNSDYRIRVHRAREDSGQGEAEITNSAVGDAVIDSGSIKWEYFPRFHDKSDEEIEKMTLKDYEKHEDERIERNTWGVANEIALRIDDAPILSDYKST